MGSAQCGAKMPALRDLPHAVLLLLLLLCTVTMSLASMRVAAALPPARAPPRLTLLLASASLPPLQVRGQERQCGLPCECPAEPPTCAPGVPAVLDGCSCCLTCARQRGETCSEHMPCDETSALYCDRSAGTQARLGVCMGEWALGWGGPDRSRNPASISPPPLPTVELGGQR